MRDAWARTGERRRAGQFWAAVAKNFEHMTGEQVSAGAAQMRCGRMGLKSKRTGGVAQALCTLRAHADCLECPHCRERLAAGAPAEQFARFATAHRACRLHYNAGLRQHGD